jgi:hypothetical protein
MNNIYDYLEAGFKIFGIHGADNGACNCGNPECEALYKHPVISGWQNVPNWSDEQIETFEMMGHFKTGFGVLCSGFLIIDVDARNGGVESFKKLCKDYPSAKTSEFVVNTGSGGGSQHHYFRLKEPTALVQAHNDYPGIDFKTSGYVIGEGSLHASGNRYETEKGYPQDVDYAPDDILTLLKKPEYHRVQVDGKSLDVNNSDIENLLSHFESSCSYEKWIKTGMAIHHALGGDGLDAWDTWSAKSDGYPGYEQLERHWHSFGKSPNPAGYGTLLHYAKEGGYCEPVTFEYVEPEVPQTLDCDNIDVLRPPGFVGELTQWINNQCLYPRENLAVAAALCAVSSLAGMRHIDELDDMSANIIAFCVAGSGTGKEAIQQAYLKIIKAAGIHGAVHGAFKSEQELMRNLIRHQAAFYSVDEMGLVLRKLDNASKKGGASYLEGIIGQVMSVYSKANGFLPLSGDLKEEIKGMMIKDLSKVSRDLDDLPQDSSTDAKRARIEKRKNQIENAIDKVDEGLDSPYLTILGYTTPVTFDSLMGFEQATNGFLARAMVFNELESNPKRKKGFRKEPMSEQLTNKIRNLYAPGKFDVLAGDERIEFTGAKDVIPTTDEAQELLSQVYESFHELAEEHKNNTGMEAIPRRGYEIASKISLILALPGGVRTAEHVKYAYKIARGDADKKIQMAYSTENQDSSDGLAAKVLSYISDEHGETIGVICNKLRNVPKEQIATLLQQMTEKGMIRLEEYKNNRGRVVKKYFSMS